MLSTIIIRADRLLAQRTPDEILTWGLLATAAICAIVALAGNPVEKAAVLAWAVLP